MEFAEFQFRVALRVSVTDSFAFLAMYSISKFFPCFIKACVNTEQYSLIALNLCVVYIRMGDSRKAKVHK
jgi:hypothetical protein